MLASPDAPLKVFTFGDGFSETLTQPHSQLVSTSVQTQKRWIHAVVFGEGRRRAEPWGVSDWCEGRQGGGLPFRQPCRGTTILYLVLYFVKLQTGCSQTLPKTLLEGSQLVRRRQGGDFPVFLRLRKVLEWEELSSYRSSFYNLQHFKLISPQ